MAHHRKLGRIASMYASRRLKEKEEGGSDSSNGSGGSGGPNGSSGPNGSAGPNGHAKEPPRTDGVYGEVLRTAPQQ